jgi:predicted acetyltransferase
MNLPTLQLIKPLPTLESEYLALVEEILTQGDHAVYGCLQYTAGKFLAADRDYSLFCRNLLNEESTEELPSDRAPQTTFWLVRNDGKIIGESRLRHYLTPPLEIEGGHIGYAIRPSERQKGYGTRLLAMTLDKARDLGLSRVLVTCDTDNLASARIIRKNGGILSDEAISPRTGEPIARYWIELE